jgi:hypothetical protein
MAVADDVMKRSLWPSDQVGTGSPATDASCIL